MEKKLTFVLGGGGARGALQAGALQVLLEAGVQPDLWVGTSVGAVNSAFLALNGFTAKGLHDLHTVWRESASAELMPSNYLWLTLRALFGRMGLPGENRFRRFFINHGLSPDLRFEDLVTRLIMVATNLTSGEIALFGDDPKQSVLDGLLASTGLPPWTTLIEKDGHTLMDGGVISNLPIEPAVNQGATRIVALDLADPRQANHTFERLGPLPGQLINSVEQRQIVLEKELAQAKGITVHHVRLLAKSLTPLWDFSHTDTLIDTGARLMTDYLKIHPELIQPEKKPWWKIMANRIKG